MRHRPKTGDFVLSEPHAYCSWHTKREFTFPERPEWNERVDGSTTWHDSSEYTAVEDLATAWIWEDYLGSSYGKAPPPKQTFIKTLTGKTIGIPYEAEDTVLRMKEKFFDVTGTPPAQQRLIWRGKMLDDERTCIDYNMPPSETLNCVVRL